MKRLMITVFFASIPLLASAETPSLFKRLERPLVFIEKAMSETNSTSAAGKMMEKSARTVAFQLQALGRLLEGHDSNFKRLKKDAKSLEDLIGQGKKYADLLEQDNLSEAKKNKYQREFEKAVAKLAQSIETDWSSGAKAREWRESLAKDSWLKSAQTDYLKQQLQKEIEDVLEKDYDMEYGEEGNGLHELRRNLRWPVMEFDLLKDMFRLTQDNSCQKKALTMIEHGKNSDYANIKFTGGKTTLSSCAYYGLVGAVERLGEIKDELEKREQLEDKLPKEIKKQALTILVAIRGSVDVGGDGDNVLAKLKNNLE